MNQTQKDRLAEMFSNLQLCVNQKESEAEWREIESFIEQEVEKPAKLEGFEAARRKKVLRVDHYNEFTEDVYPTKELYENSITKTP